MTTTVGTEAAVNTLKERLSPALDTLEENVRQTRRAIVKGRRAAEDLVEETTLEVRRHPLSAIALATGMGIVAGCLFGFALGWQVHGQTGT